MNENVYKKTILERLLGKYQIRYAKNITVNRRIQLKPTEIYKEYTKNNAEIGEKQCVNEAIAELAQLGFITVSYLKFSDDIETIYLMEEKTEDIYAYLEKEYGVVPRSMIVKQVCERLKKYSNSGSITKKYCEDILEQTENPKSMLIPEKIEENLKMIQFLEKNKENVYVREASMLVYGDSKWFEQNNYEEICSFLRMATGKVREESERNDAILTSFHVLPTEQEIFIKGAWKIEWDDYVLEISKLQGGIALASNDLPGIKHIYVNAQNVITVENKTSYQRMKNGETAMMYLGGFANRRQIEFLKKVISDNPHVIYQHFGDIDVGGFFIHRHLCRETSQFFELYCMDVKQLKDKRFAKCLKTLSDHDRERMDALMEDNLYKEVLGYMKENNIKLEQEIISYYFYQERNV